MAKIIKLNDGVQILNDESFKEKIFNYDESDTFKYEGDFPCVIDFYAEWCGPCKVLDRTLNELVDEYDNIKFYKIDIEKSIKTSVAFGVRSVPTLLFIPTNGKPTSQMGAPSKTEMKYYIDGLLIKSGDNK
jgi:thioredoxin